MVQRKGAALSNRPFHRRTSQLTTLAGRLREPASRRAYGQFAVRALQGNHLQAHSKFEDDPGIVRIVGQVRCHVQCLPPMPTFYLHRAPLLSVSVSRRIISTRRLLRTVSRGAFSRPTASGARRRIRPPVWFLGSAIPGVVHDHSSKA